MSISVLHKLSRLGAAAFVAFMVAPFIGPRSAIADIANSNDVITIHLKGGATLAPKEEKVWYEQGVWPLVGATLALIITNGITVCVVYLQSSKSFNALLRQRKIERYAASLNDFYNPLLALMDMNKEIFEKTGPPSFPKEEMARNAAGLVWKQTKKKILSNNIDIEEILRTKTHLLGEADSFDAYRNLLVHVAMYDTFQQIETDLYRKFLFPVKIRDHVADQRSIMLEAYYQLTGEQV